MKLQGLDKVIHNLNKEIRGIKNRSMKGLLKAAIMLRYDMDTTPPLIPVDLGNLRSSWFIRPLPTMWLFGPALQIGFSAFYAWYVHEMVGANFKRPGSGAKFFEAALKRNQERILEIIRKEAEVK